MFVPEHIERLIQTVYQYLKRQQDPVTEHQLLVELAVQGAWNGLTSGSAVLQQFQKHFLTMHALYRLQSRLAGINIRLYINPVAILLPRREFDISTLQITAPDTEAELREYYLDLNHLAAVNETSAADMLNGMWRQYDTWQKPEDAYGALGLPQGADWRAVQSAYRRKASQCHPDKGGSSQDFQLLRSAYESLKHTLRTDLSR